ncbi:MAG: energy-coupling factor transporter transmembrane component T, partial [Oscillospiraceae bacterium]
LSMALRFVPKFREQAKVVSNAQRCVGRDVSNGALIQRARHGVRMLSILVTWALENAIETADSMKSRGYGLPGRTAYSSSPWLWQEALVTATFPPSALPHGTHGRSPGWRPIYCYAPRPW